MGKIKWLGGEDYNSRMEEDTQKKNHKSAEISSQVFGKLEAK